MVDEDSTTCLIQALEQYDEVHCITFNYGQRHKEEIEVVQRVSQLLVQPHIKFWMSVYPMNSLTGAV